MPSAPLIRRFHQQYTPEPNTGCWLWLGKTDTRGYGMIKNGTGRTCRAHRVSFELAHGVQLPSETLVCHKCDVRTCVNPAHLFAGTPSDNLRDAFAKGRLRPPSKNGKRLSIEDVRAIRVRLAAGETQRGVARTYGMSSASICHIKTGVSWSYLR